MKKLSLLLFLFALSTIAFSQTRTIKGKIVDDAGSPISGVNVIVSGSKAGGVQTDKDGNFTITVTGNPELLVSYVGFKPTTIRTTDSDNVSVSLERQIASSDEVVVIGYQTVRRKDLVSSVSSVTGRDLKDIPLNSTAEALTGRLAGVQIVRSEGSPDAGATIRVRGGGSITQDNSPLYVVDGIQVENALSVIAPQDIASVDVLKDASATSIYGARGANGVVIITTKGGRISRPVVSYSGLVGVRKLANKLEVMEPYDFVLYQYERSRGSQADRNTFLSTYGHFQDLDLYKQAPFVDWQEQNMGRSAMMQTHNVSLTGGNTSTKYNISLTYNKEEGVMRNSDFDRKLANFKLDQVINTRAKAGVAFRYNHTEINGAGTSNPGSSSLNQLRQSVKYRPLLMGNQTVLDYDPDYADATNANSLSLINPLLLNDGTYRNRLNRTFNVSGYVSYDFNNYLSFKSTLGFDIYDTRQNSFDDTITSAARQNFDMPIASIFTGHSRTFNNSNVLTFSMNKSGSKFSDRNDLEVLLGHEIYDNLDKQYRIETRYFPVGITPERALANMGLATPPANTSQLPPTSQEMTNRLVSFFGRVNYTLDKKYLFMFTLRADGSTKFAEGNKWGYFPSGSFAWRISKEKFMENWDSPINDLKLRLSYGEAGNNRIGNFLYLSQFVANPASNAQNAFYSIGNTLIPPFYSPDLPNSLLTWESTIARNIGLDIALWKNKVQLSADFYYNSTENLLVNVTVPQTSGYTTQVQNVGETSNKGVELQISATPVSNKNFTWGSTFNISFNKNNIETLGPTQNSFLYSSGWGGGNTPSDFIVKVGQPVGTIWGLVTDGYYKLEDFDYNNGTYTLKTGVPGNTGITAVAPQPGFLKFKDISGPAGKADGVIDDFDRTIIGNTQPKFFGGWNNQFTYKNFDLSVFVNFQYGNDIYNANKLEFTSGYTPNSNLLAIMNDRWTNINSQGVVVTDPTELATLNANAKLWSPLRTASSFYTHSWAIEDGSFLRINNITLGYNFSSSLLKRAKISSLRLYATVNNLAVFTKYSGYDPEVNTRRSTPLTPGVDYSAYPRSKAYIVGVNLSL
jgi:TonB-linked SusC/RagA family outer membrane protein